MAHSKKNDDTMIARAIVPQLHVDEQTAEQTAADAAADRAAAVVAALSKSDVMWRTAEGIANEVDLSVDVVNSLLKGMSESLIRSAVPDAQGRTRYTTLRNYRAHAGILRRVLDTLSDQVR